MNDTVVNDDEEIGTITRKVLGQIMVVTMARPVYAALDELLELDLDSDTLSIEDRTTLIRAAETLERLEDKLLESVETASASPLEEELDHDPETA